MKPQPHGAFQRRDSRAGGTAARSRNSQQYTQRLSIQIEGGFRVTGRCRQVRESSFLRTCHWGGCSKMVLTFRGYAIGQSLCLPCFDPFFERRKQEGQRQSCLPRSFSVGKSRDKQKTQCCQCSTWPPVPIDSAGLLACPTQRAVLGAQEA